MKQPTAEKNGSISIWGDKGRKREKNTRICTIKLILPHFRHLQISKKRDKCSDCFSRKNKESLQLGLVQSGRSKDKELQSWIVEGENPPRAYASAHTLTRIGTHTTGVLFFCCHKCHTPRSQTLLWWRKFDIYSPQKQHVDRRKTTYRFQQNDVSLSTKRRVVFYKTTYRFS